MVQNLSHTTASFLTPPSPSPFSQRLLCNSAGSMQMIICHVTEKRAHSPCLISMYDSLADEDEEKEDQKQKRHRKNGRVNGGSTSDGGLEGDVVEGVQEEEVATTFLGEEFAVF
jgi:hypothetical protein